MYGRRRMCDGWYDDAVCARCGAIGFTSRKSCTLHKNETEAVDENSLKIPDGGYGVFMSQATFRR